MTTPPTLPDHAARLVTLLAEADIAFVVIGGVAAVLHGSSQPTEDLDVCSAMDEANLRRFADALQDQNPRFRYQPGRHMDVTTDLGRVDVHGNVPAVGGFEDVLKGAVVMNVGGRAIKVIGLEALIRSKRASSREKDAIVAHELTSLSSRVER